MTPQTKRERLTLAQLAIAALIVHDGLKLQKTFAALEGELDRLNDDRGVTERAKALIAGSAPVLDEPPAPKEEPVRWVPHSEPATTPPGPSPDDEWIPAIKAALFLDMSPMALIQNRIGNSGSHIIPFERRENRRVFYRLADLEAAKAQRAESSIVRGWRKRVVATPPGTLDTVAAARFLGLSVSSLTNDRAIFKAAKARGVPTQEAWKQVKVPFRKTGGRVFYRLSDLEAVLQGRRAELNPGTTVPPAPVLPPAQRLGSRQVEPGHGARLTKRMRKVLDTVRSMPEAKGIEIDLKRQSGHLHLLATRDGEEHRIGVLAATPSDWRGDMNFMTDIRRKLRAYAAGEVHQ